MAPSPARKRFPLVTTLVETFGFSPAIASVVALGIALLFVLAVVWVVQSAPPRKLRIASGPEGSSFQRWALSYQKALATHGVTLEIIPTDGSLDNLQRLRAPTRTVDIGFVSGGLSKDENIERLMSLGSMGYQPVWIFYRGEKTITRLSQLEGQRIAAGTAGSAARSLALTLLQANGIGEAPTTLVSLDTDAAINALAAGEVNAVFLMGDSASMRTLLRLVRTPGVQLFSFTQADAYVRRHAFLNKIELPQGSIDLGKNLPAQDVTLVGPTVELVAREGLHSALSDLLLDVAKQVHGRSNLMQKRGEFPLLAEQTIPLSPDAERYYKSGKGYLYRAVGSFWVASLLNRLLVAVVPLVLILIPTLKLLPVLYRFSIQLRLYRCYRPLLRIEHESFETLTPERAQELLGELDDIEIAVNRLKIPASFADRFYWLRSHLLSVRDRVKAAQVTPA